MSATPVDQQQQFPAPAGTLQQASTSPGGGRGSVGPVIAVLTVITILGVIAGMIGRLCSGRRIMGHGEYDVEGWLEKRCSSCLDGHVEPHRRRPVAGEDIPVAEPVEPPPEVKVEEARENEENPQETRNNGHS